MDWSQVTSELNFEESIQNRYAWSRCDIFLQSLTLYQTGITHHFTTSAYQRLYLLVITPLHVVFMSRRSSKMLLFWRRHVVFHKLSSGCCLMPGWNYHISMIIPCIMDNWNKQFNSNAFLICSYRKNTTESRKVTYERHSKKEILLALFYFLLCSCFLSSLPGGELVVGWNDLLPYSRTTMSHYHVIAEKCTLQLCRCF